MPATWTNKSAIASVEVFDVKQGDPDIYQDRGYAAYTILKKVYKTGIYNMDASFGTPLLEWLPEINGLTCRPYWVAKDTLLANWTVTSANTGSWMEQRPSWGAFRVKRLIQYDGRLNKIGQLQSNFFLPRDPHFALSFILPDTTEGWDTDTNPPYVRFEFGSDLWSLHITKQGIYVQYRPTSGDQWQTVHHVGVSAANPTGESSDERIIFIRVLRGRILISTDLGTNYSSVALRNGAYITIPQSKCRITTVGGICAFGIHQLRYYTGRFILDPKRQTFTSRFPGWIPSTLSSRSDIPVGVGGEPTEVNLYNDSDELNGLVGWVAELVPKPASGSSPWQFYTAPVIYAVTFIYSVIATTPTLDSTFPWQQYLHNITVTLPRELDQSTATIVLHSFESPLADESYRDRKVRIRLGYRTYAGVDNYYVVFTGYIANIKTSWQEWGRVETTITCKNASWKLERPKWDHFVQLSLGGRYLNQLGDLILSTEGMGTAYRTWWAAGNTQWIPAGFPEKPFELTKINESKWRTLKRCFDYYGYEVGVDNYGVYYSLPYNAYGNSVVAEYDAKEITNLEKSIANITNSYNYEHMATAVMAYGENELEQFIIAGTVDYEAELNAASLKAAPWRTVVLEELFDGVDLPTAIQRSQAISGDVYVLKQEPQIVVPIDLTMNRRTRIAINNCDRVKIPTGTQFGIANITHFYQHDQNLGQLTSSAGLELIPQVIV